MTTAPAGRLLPSRGLVLPPRGPVHAPRGWWWIALAVALLGAPAGARADDQAPRRPTPAETWAALGGSVPAVSGFGDADTIDVCGACADPALNMFGLDYVGEEMWVLGTDGTMYRMSPDRCQVLATISIQGFTGVAAGLGYDSKRDLMVVTDAINEVILRLTRQGVVVDTFPTPGTGAVGIAYDPNRDWYWVTDFEADAIQAVDATTGAPGPQYTNNYGARLAGTGFDPVLDAIVYNSRGFDGAERPPSTHWMDAATGVRFRTVPVPFLSVNNATGAGVAPGGDVWVHHTELRQSVCVAKREDDGTTRVAPASWGRLKLIYR